MSIAGNIEKIEERVQKVCNSLGRKRDDITLMGVSKFVPLNIVEQALCAGINCFGESRVKEGTEKFRFLKEERPQIKLHLIGSLQRNKAKSAALFFDCIQSVDRRELVEELLKYVLLREKPLEILFELHTGEEAKSGFTSLDDLFKAAELALNCVNLKPAGLMTMAPFIRPPLDAQDAGVIRSSFRRLVKAQEELKKRFPSESWNCLSMGMSNDFEIAVEEGSTMLRIGTLIFKEL